MRRSSLPGRNKAASSKSGRDVAARTHTPALELYLAQQRPNALWLCTSSIVSKTCQGSMRKHCAPVYLTGQVSQSPYRHQPHVHCTSYMIVYPAKQANHGRLLHLCTSYSMLSNSGDCLKRRCTSRDGVDISIGVQGKGRDL